MNPFTRTLHRLRAATAAALMRVASAVRGPRAPARMSLPAMMARIFAGAKMDRLTQDFFSGTTSGSQDLRLDLQRLRNRSRTLVRDTAEAKRYCGLMEENVVGEAGILLKPAVLTASGNADAAVNDAVLEAWQLWGRPASCTVDGQFGWTELEQAIMRLWPMDGEVLLRLVDGVGPFGFALQLLDPDQLDETFNTEPFGDGRWIRQGVELDKWGRPIAYHIWDGHPNDTRRGVRRRIPAEDIVHLFIPWRPGARRGIPWLHAAITNINMLNGFVEAALVAARVAASAMGAIEGAADPDPNDESAPTDAEIPVEFDPGKFLRLAAGEKVTMLDPKHPTTSFAEFHKANVRSIAQAGGVSYTSLSGDLAEVNYSSIRAGLLSERDHYRILQRRLTRALHDRVYRRWLRMAQLTGALRLSAQDVARAERVRWQARGFPWVDPRADIEALRAEIRLGLNSRTNAAAERGRDFEKVLEQIDEEERLAEEYGVDVSGVDLPPQAVAAAAEDATSTPTKKPARETPLRIAQ